MRLPEWIYLIGTKKHTVPYIKIVVMIQLLVKLSVCIQVLVFFKIHILRRKQFQLKAVSSR